MGILHGLLTLALAPRCLGCNGATGDADALVCGRCRSRLVAPPPPLCDRCGMPRLRTGREPGPTCQECGGWPAGLRAARSACLLRAPADALVYQLKYRGWRRLAVPMGERMARVPLPRDVARECRLAVPVATTTVRLRERGYNQAALLADAFAAATDRTILDALRRGGGAGSQITLQPAARLANVAGAFSLRPGAGGDVAGEHLLLIDDVLTTGATVIAATETLLAGGARCVSILTFARATGRLRLN